MALLFYIVVKFVAYVVWCAYGWYLLHKCAAGYGTAVRLGGLRWLMGVGFGVLIFLFLPTDAQGSDLIAVYVAVYTPVRILEWTIMGGIISARRLRLTPRAGLLNAVWWVGGGVGLSFLTDIASPAGLQGMFCVGRCLC